MNKYELKILGMNDLSYSGIHKVGNGKQIEINESFFQNSSLNKSSIARYDLIIFLNNKKIRILKDRTGSWELAQNGNVDTQMRFRDQKRSILYPCKLQLNYLYELLEYSKTLKMSINEQQLALKVFLQRWYPDTYKGDLNDLRKKYIKVLTIGNTT